MREGDQVRDQVSSQVGRLAHEQFRQVWTQVQIRAHRLVYWQLVRQVDDGFYGQVEENLTT